MCSAHLLTAVYEFVCLTVCVGFGSHDQCKEVSLFQVTYMCVVIFPVSEILLATVGQSVCLSVCLLSVCCLPVFQAISLSACQSVSQSIIPSVLFSVCLSVSLPVCQSVRLSVGPRAEVLQRRGSMEDCLRWWWCCCCCPCY